MYFEITDDIRVEVEPEYVPEQSKPKENYFFFSYRVKITNESTAPVQLVSRHWIITDGSGVVHEVQGEGVVGHQPKLAPGESFEYSSFCPLPTPTGNMRGSYRMVGETNKRFDVKIPLFFLRDLRNFH
jgi:ApaG protein